METLWKTIILKCKRFIHSRINILQYGLKKYTKDFDRNMKLKPNTGSIEIIGRVNVTSFSINVSSSWFNSIFPINSASLYIRTRTRARTHAPTLTSNRGRAANPPEIPGVSLSSFPNLQFPAAGRCVSGLPGGAPRVRGSRPDHTLSPGIGCFFFF